MSPVFRSGVFLSPDVPMVLGIGSHADRSGHFGGADMNDRNVSAGLGCIAAWVLWTVSLALWVASVFFDHRPIATLALMLCGAAVTATIRCYMVALNERFKSALAVTMAVDSVSRLPVKQ